MAVYEYRTFLDLQNAVMEALGIQSTDTVARNRIKRNINHIYEEVVDFSNWPWARKTISLSVQPYVSSGTAMVTAGSVSVTLSQAISTSKKGFYFAINGYNEVYKIKAHAAGGTTLSLEVPFTGTTASAATFKIWTDAIPLPSDCRETISVRHNFRDKPLENYGLQEFRRTVQTGPQAEGRPAIYTTSDWQDPAPYETITSLPAAVSRSSSGLVKTLTFAASIASYISEGDRLEITSAGDYTYNIEAIAGTVSGSSLTFTGTVAIQESTTADTAFVVKKLGTESYERYRELLVYPVISQNRTTLELDYKKSVPPLEDDTDEPLMPLNQRAVLFYGTLWLSAGRHRNPEWATENLSLYRDRLNRMAGKTEDTPDKPVITLSKNYMGQKRSGYRNRSSDISGGRGFGGGGSGSSSVVTGTANTAAIFNSTGDLQGSATISTTELEFLNNAEGLTSVTLADNTTTTAASWTAATFSFVSLKFSLSRSTARASGTIDIMTDGSTVTVAVSGPSDINAPGVTFSGDISAGSVRLRATLTSTGSTATMKYVVVNKWLM